MRTSTKSKDGVCSLLAPAHFPTIPACLTFSCQARKVVWPEGILASGTHVVMAAARNAEKLTPSRSSPPLRADGRCDTYPSFLDLRYNDSPAFSTLADGLPRRPRLQEPTVVAELGTLFWLSSLPSLTSRRPSGVPFTAQRQSLQVDPHLRLSFLGDQS